MLKSTQVDYGKLSVTVSELTFGQDRTMRAAMRGLGEAVREHLCDSEMSDAECDALLDAPAGVAYDNDVFFLAFAVAQSSQPKGFKLPKTTPEAIIAFYDSIADLPVIFVERWFDAALNLRSGFDPELQPGLDIDKLPEGDEKKESS